MTSSQQFSLKWTNYTNHITNAFDTLRSKEDFCDVTLSCEGRKIRAHKVLLSACSTYFKEIFKENPCQHPVIIFKNVKYDDLLSIVVYMYQGEVNIEQDALPTFLHTAEMLSIQGLTEDDSTQQEKSIIAVQQPAPPPPQPQQQSVVAAAIATHAPQNTITIHGQAIGKTIRTDGSHITGPKFTLSKPLSIIGSNSTPVDQIVYTTVTQAPTTLMQTDVLPAKRKRKIVTQVEKPQTYVEAQKTSSQTIPVDPLDHEPGYLKSELDAEMTGEYTEDDKAYHTEGEGDGEGEIETYEGSQDEEGKHDDDYDKPKLATQAELGRLFSSGGTPTPDSKRNSQSGPNAPWTTDSGDDLKCKVCNRPFASIAARRRHIASRHMQLKALTACKTCGKEFKTKWSLATHVSRFHR